MMIRMKAVIKNWKQAKGENKHISSISLPFVNFELFFFFFTVYSIILISILVCKK